MIVNYNGSAAKAEEVVKEIYEYKKVVVTGMGAITPIGNSVEAFWTAKTVKSNTVGIAPITHFDTADFKCKLAAE